MREEAKTSNDTNIIQMQLKNKINEADSIIIADENENEQLSGSHFFVHF